MTNKKKITLTENQLIEIAKREEIQMQNKQEISKKIKQLLAETITAKEILNEAQKNKGKIMFSIGATILLEAQLTNNKNCKRALSDNSYQEDTIVETKKWLEKKEEQIKKQFKSINAELIEHQKKLTNYVNILKQIDSEKRKTIQKAKQSPPTLSK